MNDPLARYNAKRDFTRTREPEGKRSASGESRIFVVQKHAATRLHWDFRLEVDGVLKSWAVTRGPSSDPDDKRLAVRTEDHPMSYATFEGTIPQDQYGGGTVMLWDRGTWEPIAGKSAADLDQGHLHFTLHGERMKGEWLLVRIKGRPGEKRENWLLRKIADDAAGTGDELVEEALTSVTTGRSMAEIAASAAPRRSAGKTGGNARVRKAPLPAFAPPQLATLVDAVPTGSGWMHEIKFDGYRALIAVNGPGVRIYTRNGLDWTDKFTPLARQMAALDLPPALIDGEIIALDGDGNPDFAALQGILKRGNGAQTDVTPLHYFAFDLLSLDGQDLRGRSNIERKERLEALLHAAHPPIHVADHVIGSGERLLQTMCAAGQEGIISKRMDAPYGGNRTRNWVKVKCTRRQEFVIVGWQASRARGRPFSSILLGQTDATGQLSYRGKVGTGFDAGTLDDLARAFRRLERKAPAVANVPREAARGAHWIEPKLVAEIAFSEFTGEDRVRHGSFLGLRADKAAAEVQTERPEPNPPAATAVDISSRSRIIFPDNGMTKGDLADYYAAIAPLFLAHGANRPISLVRCPQGRARQCFFQKHDSGALGKHVGRVPIREKDGGTEDYLYLLDADGILACVQMGTIEFHGWAARADSVERPDRMIFDLDPDEGLDFAAVKNAARFLRDRLAELGLSSFAMLSGGKGIHVIVPLTPGHDWDAHKDFAKRFAEALSASEPDRFVSTISKAKRKGRIFIDWLRNQRGSTAVLPYSARARPGAPVAAPVTWQELEAMGSAHPFSIADAQKLAARAVRKDLQGWGFAAQSLPDI